ATAIGVSADAVAASNVRRTLRSVLPMAAYVPEKLGPWLDSALHVPSAASVMDVAKAAWAAPHPRTTKFDLPVRVPVPVNAFAAVGAASARAIVANAVRASTRRRPDKSIIVLPSHGFERAAIEREPSRARISRGPGSRAPAMRRSAPPRYLTNPS